MYYVCIYIWFLDSGKKIKFELQVDEIRAFLDDTGWISALYLVCVLCHKFTLYIFVTLITVIFADKQIMLIANGEN